MAVRLDAVPLRDASLTPPEILMSESQERMMAICEPARLADFLAVCARWEVRATVIGEVTGTGRLEGTWHGGRRGHLPPRPPPAGPASGQAGRPPARPE